MKRLILILLLQLNLFTLIDAEAVAANISLSSLTQKIKSIFKPNAIVSANHAANFLGKSGASVSQTQTVLANEVSKGTVSAPVKIQNFFSKIGDQFKALKYTGANAKISMNKVASIVDYKPYTEVQLRSGSKILLNQSTVDSYQVKSAEGKVLFRGSEKRSPKLKLKGKVDANALAKFKGQLAESAARIDIAKAEYQGLKLKVKANQASPADKLRITKLGKNIPKYEKAYKSLEKQTSLKSSSLKGAFGDAAKFALTSIGIRAGINILSQAIQNDGKVDFKNALSFMADKSFWGGTAGGFLGSMIASTVGSMIIPGGGALMRALPGFIGAAAGFEVGSGSLEKTNWVQLLASTGASAAAFALIGGPVGIGASILAGMVVNKLFEKDDPFSEMDIYSEKWNDVAHPDIMMQGPSNQDFQQFTKLDAPAVASLAPIVINKKKITVINTNTELLDIVEISAKMKVHYKSYINFLKEKQALDAAAEFEKYNRLRKQIQRAKGEI
ncbi:MAG: hypothetical protein COB02_03605 [Candidatus Cloacimonadota bacterium]|nr:MAG: hypothetical protein COB02_03605 [Candidatus Cloacimonadota bacterium]